jgi:hypothetical protein
MFRLVQFCGRGVSGTLVLVLVLSVSGFCRTVCGRLFVGMWKVVRGSVCIKVLDILSI